MVGDKGTGNPSVRVRLGERSADLGLSQTAKQDGNEMAQSQQQEGMASGETTVGMEHPS